MLLLLVAQELLHLRMSDGHATKDAQQNDGDHGIPIRDFRIASDCEPEQVFDQVERGKTGGYDTKFHAKVAALNFAILHSCEQPRHCP